MVGTLAVLSVFTLLSQAVQEADIYQHIQYLASDSLQGRKPGTSGGQQAGEYIRKQLLGDGLTPLCEDGFQAFEVVTSVEKGSGNQLIIQGRKANLTTDFTPFSFSKNGRLNANVVFAGYGFDFSLDSLQWNDYQEVDVKGKWVLLLRGHPGPEKGPNPYSPFGDERGKVLSARDHGAAGVLFVNPCSSDEKDLLTPLYYDKSQSDAGVLVVHISRLLADSLLQDNTVKALENQLQETLMPQSKELVKTVDAQVDLRFTKVKTRNVVALIEGRDPVLKDSYLVIGAHYDHLGWGGPGSGSRRPDTLAIHNGADDNASGVAALLELAEALSRDANKPRHSIVFVAFGAEEMGILGSKYFVEHPPIDLSKIQMMLNFDMLGRLKADTRTILVGGTGTAREAESLLQKVGTGRDFSMGFSPEGFGASDHASFYAKDLPVLFLSTGAHADYHTPEDDLERLDLEGETAIVEMAFDLIREMDNRSEAFTFQEAGPKERPRGGARFKVTLGIMPDFTAASSDGLRVDAVRKAGPADKGGMKKGDVIVALDGLEVTNIYDYMSRLKKLEAGRVVTVDVMRNNKKIVLLISL